MKKTKKATPKKKVVKPHDPVNNPSHYTDGNIEVIDFIEDKLNLEEFRGFLKGNVIKYVVRADKKVNPKEDMQKGEWYLKKLIENTTNKVK